MAKSSTNSLAMWAAIVLLGGYALVGGSLSFLGWALDVPRLTDWYDDRVSIQPNTCVLVSAAGAAVIFVQLRAWRLVSILGIFVSLAGAAILLQHITGVDFGIDQLLLFGRNWGGRATVAPGRVGPPASASFALIGVALWMLGRAARAERARETRRFVPAIGVAVCLIMTFSLLGYVFSAESFYSIPWLTAIAMPTSTMLLALGITLILCVPEHEPMLLLREKSGSGSTARFTTPAIVLAIPLVHWLCNQGVQREYFDRGTGDALANLTLIMAGLATLWNALMAVRRHEIALRDVDRRKDEFLATLAHELRNPLAPLQSGLEVIKLSANDAEPLTKVLQTMQDQVSHLASLVDDLLDISRISTGKLKLRQQYVALSEVIRNAVELCRPSIERGKHQLHIEQPPEAITLLGDPHRLNQILSNVIHNAAKYTPTGGNI